MRRNRQNRIYLSGPITGVDNYKIIFSAYAIRLWRLEWEVVNPATACPPKWGYWRCMARCIRLELGCGAIAMIPGWEKSRGAKIEHRIARMMGLQVIYLKPMRY